MPTTESLPELQTEQQDLKVDARELFSVRKQIASLQEREKAIKKQIVSKASILRVEKTASKEFIGMVRIVGDGVPACRVDFKMGTCPIDVDQEGTLDSMYGASRPLLFSREKRVTDIINPAQVILDLENSGKNPWDYLEMRVKNNMDTIVSDSSTEVITSEAFLPVKGFLAKLNGVAQGLKDSTIEYTKGLLESALKPAVVASKK